MLKIFSAPANVQGGIRVKQATADMFGGGSGLIELGDGLTDFAEGMDKRAEKVSKSKADQSYVDERSYWLEELQRRKDTAEEGAPDFTRNFKAEYNTRIQSILSSSGLTDTAKTYAAQKFERLRGALIADSVAYESKSSAVMRTRVIKKGLDTFVNEAFTNRNLYQDTLDDGLDLIDQSAEDNGNARAKIAATFREELAHSTILGEVSRDPTEALKMLADPKWVGELTDASYQQLFRAATSKQSAQDARSVAAQSKANSAARSAVGRVDEIYKDGRIPTPKVVAETEALIAASDDEHLKKQYSDLRAYSGQLNELKEMNSAELGHILDALPQPGEPTTPLQLVTMKAARVILSGVQASENTLLGDLTGEISKVLDSGGKPTKASLILLSELQKTATDRSTVTAANELLVRLSTTGALKNLDLSKTSLDAALAGVTATADADGERTVLEAAQINTVRAFTKNANRVLTEDGALSWYRGRTDTVINPVDFSRIDSMSERFQTARALQHQSGASKYQYFLPHELADFKEKLKDQGPTDRIAQYRAILEAGGEDAYKAFKEISDSGSSRIGYVAGMANHTNPALVSLAAEIEHGAIILEGPDGVKRAPEGNKVETQINIALGAALARAPEGTRAGIVDSTRALFVARGMDPTNLPLADIQRLVGEVTGGALYTVNGTKTLLPIGMDKNTFEDTISGLDDAGIARAFGVAGAAPKLLDRQGEPVSANEVSDGVFEYVGPNKYYVRKKNRAEYVLGADGTPAVFDLSGVTSIDSDL